MSNGNRFSRFLGVGLALGMGLAGLAFIASVTLDSRRGGDPRMAMISISGAMGLFWLIFRGPVGKALAGMLEGDRQGDAVMQGNLESRLAYLEQHGLTSGEVEAAFGRIAELEDRLDFTERLLAQVQNEPMKEVGRGS
ncbi:MAG: hypothetical protein V4558_01305 [Gemmatimonadota bacterium]